MKACSSLETVTAASLKRVALRHLSRREYSREELTRKLLAAATKAADPQEHGAADSGTAALVRAVVDELQSKGFQSDQRTAEVLIQSRASRWGQRRLQAELKRKGLPDELVRSALAPSSSTELARAEALWLRRFGSAAPDSAERSRQMRFLAARGFSMDVIARVVRGQSAHGDDIADECCS